MVIISHSFREEPAAKSPECDNCKLSLTLAFICIPNPLIYVMTQHGTVGINKRDK